MELEVHQLDLRYERLHVRSPRRQRDLVAAIAEGGQRIPVAVTRDGGEPERFVVVDGFPCVRALRQLGRDTVLVTVWDLSELEALLLCRSLRDSQGQGESALEQAWFLEELRLRFGLTLEQLARSFERTISWVSRRLALVQELPASVQDAVREGRLAAHAAAKFLVPLARANPDHCERLARGACEGRLSSRQVGELYAAWRDGSTTFRERIAAEPLLFLKTQQAVVKTETPREELLRDVAVLAATARRAVRRLGEGAAENLSPLDHDRIVAGLRLVRTEVRRLLEAVPEREEESFDARPQHTSSDPRAAEARALDPPDLAHAEGLQERGPQGVLVGVG